MHKQIDVLDEDRYDHEVKVAKNENEVRVFVMEMNISCQEYWRAASSPSPLGEHWAFEDQKNERSSLNPPSIKDYIYLPLVYYKFNSYIPYQKSMGAAEIRLMRPVRLGAERMCPDRRH